MRGVTARPRLPRNPKYNLRYLYFRLLYQIFVKRQKGTRNTPVTAATLVTGAGGRAGGLKRANTASMEVPVLCWKM